MSAPDRPTAPAHTDPLPRLGFVLLVLLTLVWGSNWPIMKTALSEMPPWTFRTFTVLGAAAGLFVICRLAGISLAVPHGQRLILVVVALFNITGWHMLSAMGISLMAAGRASIIAFTMPVWVVLLGALFLGEKVTARRLVALSLGLGGLAVLIGGDLAMLREAPLGAMFMSLAAITWASGTVILKRVIWNVPVIALTVWQLTIGGIPIVISAMVFETPLFTPVSTTTMLAVAYNVIVCVIFGNYAWFKIVSLFPAGIAGISSLMIPVIGVLSSALVLGEPLGVQELGALALVVAALATVLYGQSSARKSTR